MNQQEFEKIFPALSAIPPEYQVAALEQKEYLVNGEIKIWSGAVQDVYSPVFVFEKGRFTPRRLGSYPLFSEAAALEALQAAYQAFAQGRGQWPCMSVEQRINCVSEFTKLMLEKREAIVNMLMWEIAKPHKDAAKEFDRTIEYIQDTIDALKNLDRISSRFELEAGILAQIRRAPYGVVLCMGPFNYPLNETFTTLIPALIMGNTVLFKPAKYGVLLLQPLLKAFKQAFPPGVVNTIYGEGKVVVGPLMQSGKIDVLAFIGSSKVANLIEKQHPALNRLHTIYGLDAKNPAIILKDADLAITVKECISGTLSFNGQRCTALKILFVEQSLVEQFLKQYCAALAELKIGMPWEEGVHITPLPENGKTAWLNAFVTDAVRNGALVVNPDGGLVSHSLFYPAVLYPVNSTMRIYHEEQFGPVVPVVPFTSLEEPIEYVVNSPYGQQASIFSSNSAAIAELIDPLVNQVCRVNVNSTCQRGPDVFPFTGRKNSAIGTLSVSDALRVFSIRALVAAKEIDLNKKIIREIVTQRQSNFLSTDFIF